MEGEDQSNILRWNHRHLTPYYFTRRKDYDSKKHTITVIEVIGISRHGSGEAGGLFAIWAYPNNLSGNSKATKGKSQDPDLPKDLDWVMPDWVQSDLNIGGRKQTAQVNPYQFTMSTVRLAREKGANTTIDSRRPANPHTIICVSDLRFSSGGSRGRVSGITYPDTQSGTSCSISATTRMSPAGGWTSKPFRLAATPPLRAHNMTMTPPSPVSGYAHFTEITIPPTPPSPVQHTQPSNTVFQQMYTGSKNEIYVSGAGYMETRCDDLIAPVSSLSHHIRLGHRTRKQSCNLPVLNLGGSGGPHIGEAGTEGTLMTTGYWC
ncbi:hypothetical protein HOY80DRAFT_1014551 [Tuber brumale]|nr:hypothetical protein HOY80DRAFT_1014551 [Tuber brumale]